jgi:hypothetical protein
MTPSFQNGDALRAVLTLDGAWQAEEGGMDRQPEIFGHTAQVPGLLSQAKPSFIEPGPRVADRNEAPQKDPQHR